MKNGNVIQEKSYNFALRIVKVCKYLIEENKEYQFSRQLFRCGTSVGANVEEAIGGQSEKDFYAKLTISYKEARETKYWLRLMKDSGYLEQELVESLIEDCEELLRIIGSIQKTMRKKMQQPIRN